MSKKDYIGELIWKDWKKLDIRRQGKWLYSGLSILMNRVLYDTIVKHLIE